MKKRELIAKLSEVLNSSAELLAKIRYQDWPTIGLGIGLTEEMFDEVLADVERVEKDLKRWRKRKEA